MLIVLQAAPCPTPPEALTEEEAVGRIIAEQAIGRGYRTVGIGFACSRTDAHLSVSPSPDAGIVARIDIHRLAQSVSGKAGRSRYAAIIEAGRIVRCHRQFIVGPETVNEEHALNGVTLLVETAEYADEAEGDIAMAYHLAEPDAAFGIAMEETQITQCGNIYTATLGQAAPLHQTENAVGDFDGFETAVFAIRRHCPCADNLPDAPLPKHFRTRSRDAGMQRQEHDKKEEEANHG